VSWWSYVQRVSREAPQHAIATRTGLSQSTINRWQSGEPKPGNVRAFAEAYERPVLEAFVEAGFLNQQQANLITPPMDLTRVSDDDLINEVKRRLKR
jgi:transcriptional regulator with XRE-family HTH domain